MALLRPLLGLSTAHHSRRGPRSLSPNQASSASSWLPFGATGLDWLSPALSKGGKKSLSQCPPCPIFLGRRGHDSPLGSWGRGETQAILHDQELSLHPPSAFLDLLWKIRAVQSGEEDFRDSIYHALINRPRGEGVKGREGPWGLLGNFLLSLGAEAQPLP